MGLRRAVRRVAREPVVHFLLVGGLAFAAAPTRQPEIILTTKELEAAETEFRVEAGRAPSEDERAALRERVVADRILLAEAFRLGLDRHDSAVATRLSRIGSFVSDADGEPPDAPATRARELGLERSDVVIRRYLVERMRQRLARGADRTMPREAELETHLRAHAARFTLPERIRLQHVFVSSRGGEDLFARARAIGAQLPALPLEDAALLGDSFPRSRRLDGSPDAIDRTFGPGFLAALDRDRIGQWQGPLRSAYGLHFVFVDSHAAPRMPGLEAVRSRVEQDLLSARRKQRVDQRLAELRQDYAVRWP